MGWIFTFVFVIVAAALGEISANAALIASSIFAVAGAIGSVAVVLKGKQEPKDK